MKIRLLISFFLLQNQMVNMIFIWFKRRGFILILIINTLNKSTRGYIIIRIEKRVLFIFNLGVNI